MNTIKKTLGILILTMLLGLSAHGQLIIPLGTPGDNYIGGDPTSSSYDGADVIGANSVFDLTGGEISYNTATGSLEVKILGNYFDNILSDTGLLGTEMGDLFISTDGLNWGGSGENSDTTLDYVGSGNETSWEYDVQLGTYKQPGLSSGTVIDGKMIDMSADGVGVSLSNAGGIHRALQEHQVTGQWAHNLTDPTWVIEDGSLTMTINDFAGFFGTGIETMGFHWTMECANDVIEFELVFPTGTITTVPEPATIGILGLMGMTGILFLRRRIVRRK